MVCYLVTALYLLFTLTVARPAPALVKQFEENDIVNFIAVDFNMKIEQTVSGRMFKRLVTVVAF